MGQSNGAQFKVVSAFRRCPLIEVSLYSVRMCAHAYLLVSKCIHLYVVYIHNMYTYIYVYVHAVFIHLYICTYILFMLLNSKYSLISLYLICSLKITLIGSTYVRTVKPVYEDHSRDK